MEFMLNLGIWVFMCVCAFLVIFGVIIFSYGAVRYKTLSWMKIARQEEVDDLW